MADQQRIAKLEKRLAKQQVIIDGFVSGKNGKPSFPYLLSKISDLQNNQSKETTTKGKKKTPNSYQTFCSKWMKEDWEGCIEVLEEGLKIIPELKAGLRTFKKTPIAREYLKTPNAKDVGLRYKYAVSV